MSSKSADSSLGRKTHRKVRTGCLNCKKRRVKCTEEKPKCRSCVRRATPCEYPPLAHNSIVRVISPVPSSASSTISPAVQSPEPQSTAPSQHDSPCPAALPTSLVSEFPTSLSRNSLDALFSLQDLKLLLHWTKCTSQQVAKGREVCNFWQNTATDVALQYPFVMQEMMSIAALHIAYLSPSEEPLYLGIANDHHNESLQGFNTAVSECGNDTQHGSSLFLWMILNIFYVFATLGRVARRSDMSVGDHRDCVLGTVWIPLIRGIRSVTQIIRPVVERNAFKAVVNIGNWRTLDPTKYMGDEASHFDLLANVWENSSDKEIYDNALDVLRRCHAFITQFETTEGETAGEWEIGNKTSGPFLFIFISPEEFFEHLQQRQPAALVLFSFFGALLHSLDDCWAMQGWGKDIVSVIDDLLGSYWRPWTAWPREVVGLQEK